MTNQLTENSTVGLLPDKVYSIDETIVDYKFNFKNIEYKIDIYIAYEANRVNELIKVKLNVKKIGVFNKTNRMCYNCEIRANDLFCDPILRIILLI